jgi:hypothetical protein
VIAAGFERWEEGGRGGRKGESNPSGGGSQVLGLDNVHEDIFATPDDDDLDLGDDEFDVPSFLR